MNANAWDGPEPAPRLVTALPDPRPCTTCKDWGLTYWGRCAVDCPACKRPVFPNLGVNVPAGAAVGLASSGTVGYLADRAAEAAARATYVYGRTRFGGKARRGWKR